MADEACPIKMKVPPPPAEPEQKFELILTHEEAQIIMGLGGRTNGGTKRGKMMHKIYHALAAAGVKGQAFHLNVESKGSEILIKDT